MRRKKILPMILAGTLALSLLVTGCGKDAANTTADGTGAEEKIVLRVANPQATGDKVTLGLEKLQQLVAEKSEGSLEIELYSNAVLGSDRATTEQAQSGALDMASCSSPNMSSFMPAFMALDLPYITTPEYQQNLYAAIDTGELGNFYREEAREVGLEIIMFSEYGYRNFVSSEKPLASIDDLKNMKLRTTDSRVEVATAEALGAIAMPIAWGETYTALQQGSVDGEGNTFSLLYTAKHHEALKYAIDSQHNYSMHVLVMNKAKYDGLSDEHKTILQESAQEALDYQRGIADQIEEESLQAFIDAGIEVHMLTAEEKQAFKDATKPVWSAFPDEISQDVIDMILETQK